MVEGHLVNASIPYKNNAKSLQEIASCSVDGKMISDPDETRKPLAEYYKISSWKQFCMCSQGQR